MRSRFPFSYSHYAARPQRARRSVAEMPGARPRLTPQLRRRQLLLPRRRLSPSLPWTPPLPLPFAAPVAPLPPAPTTTTNGDSGSVVSGGGSQTAPPPKGPRYRQFSIGPEVGLFLPTDSKTRNRFGDSWFSIGIGIGDIIPPKRGGDLSLDLNVISQAGDNRHAYLIPVGVQYRQALNRSQTVNSASSVVPYIGVSADVVFADVRSPIDDAHSGLRTTGGGSVFIGTSLSTRAFVEARYLAVGSTEHFNLSGFDLSAGFRF